jgi:excisionase family DNA binding protein
MSSSPGPATKLLTPADAAVFLTLRESTLRDYARRGIVPSVKLGRHLRFVEADLVTYLERLRDRRAVHAGR